MKLISWNVNGIRAILKKNFLSYVQEEDPDILCVQETKAHPEQVDITLASYPHHFWNAAERKGYSGTAIFSKHEPLAAFYGIGILKHDQEGRVITLEYPKYYLVNVYVPNSGDGLRRLAYRQEWDSDLRKYLEKLQRKKPVIVCGDLNVAYAEIDLARPDDNHHNAGFTDEERAGLATHFKAGFIDSFRVLHPGEPGHYSWWSFRTRARERNIGWRIDYFLVSEPLKKQLKTAFIRDQVLGSDHCPVGVVL